MRSWEEKIRKVVPYTPGEQPEKKEIIKLNTNENPYPPSPAVTKILEQVDEDSLRKYPDPNCNILKDSIANFYNLDRKQVFVGVGSDDVLSVAFLTFFNSDKPVLFPDITYSFYSVWADVYRIPYKTKPLDENFKIVNSDYYEENGGVIFPNPNAPTSVYKNLDEIEDIIKNNQDVIVIVDEAYIDFGGRSAMEIMDKYDNLVVVQTYSKSRSLAGLRIGYAVSGNPQLIKAMEDVKFSINSYTMNQTALSAGAECMNDREYFNETVAKIIQTREESVKKFEELGFECLPSQTNFFFVKHNSIPAKQIFEELRENDIYVRYFNAPRIDNYLRISIGTPGQMEELFKNLVNIVNR